MIVGNSRSAVFSRTKRTSSGGVNYKRCAEYLLSPAPRNPNFPLAAFVARAVESLNVTKDRGPRFFRRSRQRVIEAGPVNVPSRAIWIENEIVFEKRRLASGGVDAEGWKMRIREKQFPQS